MLVRSKQLAESQVLSLHTGQVIARLVAPIINPHQLEVIGFYVDHAKNKQEAMVLLAGDIRQSQAGRVFINSVDELTTISDLIRLKDLIEIKYVVTDKPVRTVSKKKLGKVEEYAVDTLTWQIQKLYVKRSVFKSFSTHSLVIDRQQVLEVSDSEITVNDAVVNQPVVVPQQAV